MNSKISNDKKLKLTAVIFSVFFTGLLILLLAAGIIEPDKEYSESENRKLASFPELSVSRIADGRFMTDFEEYMSDRFFGRNTLVSVKAYFSRLLGETEINDVYIGRNGRLYEVPSDFQKDRVEKTVNAIKEFSISCNIQNRYFMLIPNATEIIPEDLPLLLRCEGQAEQIEDIYSGLDTFVDTVDAVSALSEYENREELYFRTDHHWTSKGALTAFRAFSNKLQLEEYENGYKEITVSNSFSGTLSSSSGISDSLDTLEVILPEGIDGTYYIRNAGTLNKSSSVLDISKLESKNQYEVFFGGNFSRLELYTANLNERNLLIFKDSYANCFIPFLIPHFEKIVVIDPRYFTEDINDILKDTEFTHLLYLYNVNTFLEDTVLSDCID